MSDHWKLILKAGLVTRKLIRLLIKVLMEVLFLGTSAGTHTKSRNVAGVAIKMVSYKYC